jgi:hypothetical protein
MSIYKGHQAIIPVRSGARPIRARGLDGAMKAMDVMFIPTAIRISLSMMPTFFFIIVSFTAIADKTNL